MKASKLIVELQKLIEEFGDREVKFILVRGEEGEDFRRVGYHKPTQEFHLL